MLQAAGERPCCLSRGYGGSLAGPKLVDAQADRAAQVGDEALLLARVAPTDDRARPRRRRQGRAPPGASVVIMDDGLQNASLVKDFTLAVVDGRRGIGNARVFPAGPLRAPLDAQLARTDALLVVGEDTGAGDVVAEAAARRLPVFHGRLVPDPAAVAALKARKVLAFAGIGDPEKFFATVAQAGIAIAQRKAFADHHRYTAEEAAELIMQAEHDGLALLTTEKDRARMAGEPLLAALAAKAHVLPVTLVVNEADELRALVLAKVRLNSAGRLFRALRLAPLQHRLRRGIGLLQIDAPVFELLERDRHAGHRAAHKGAGAHHAEIAIEVFHLGLAAHRRGAIIAIEQRRPPFLLGGIAKENIWRFRRKPSNPAFSETEPPEKGCPPPRPAAAAARAVCARGRRKCVLAVRSRADAAIGKFDIEPHATADGGGRCARGCRRRRAPAQSRV